MTKPMPVGGIKDKEPNWKEFNLLMETVTLDDPRGHMVVVDIEFDHLNATPRQIMYNEIFPPSCRKKEDFRAQREIGFSITGTLF